MPASFKVEKQKQKKDNNLASQMRIYKFIFRSP